MLGDKSSSDSGRTLHSFDVFDTAITRLTLGPDHLHWAVGRELKATGAVNVCEDDWRAARLAAETTLRRLRRRHGRRDEVKLSEIYGELGRMLALSAPQREVAMAAETLKELQLVRAIAQTSSRILALRSRAKRYCFVSDTYFSGEQVAALLARCDYADAPVYSSADYNETKADGELFSEVASANGIACADIKHFGDNAASDFARARDAGCDAELYNDARSTARETLLFRAGGGKLPASLVAGAARAARLGYAGTCSAGMRSASSSAVGPLLAAYVLWIVRDVLARGGRKLYFLSRDGQVLRQICNELSAFLGVDIDARYLLCSRQALFLASLPQNVPEAVAASLDEAHRETLLGLLRSLDFNSEDATAILQSATLSGKTRVDSLNEDERQRVVETLCAAPWASLLEKRLPEARAALIAYLDQNEVFAENVAYIVDLGWHGNLQRRMQRVIGAKAQLFGYYMQLYTTPPEIKGAVSGWTQSNWTRAALLETFTLADHTSVRGFAIDDAGEAVCRPPLAPEHYLIAWGVREQQAIVALFVRHLVAAASGLCTVNEIYDALHAGGIAAFSDFVQAPTPDEAHAYGGIELAGDQNHADKTEVAPRPGNFAALRMLFDGKFRRSRTNWIWGSLARCQSPIMPAALRGVAKFTQSGGRPR